VIGGGLLVAIGLVLRWVAKPPRGARAETGTRKPE
jgi:hypothetical protein